MPLRQKRRYERERKRERARERKRERARESKREQERERERSSCDQSIIKVEDSLKSSELQLKFDNASPRIS